jgi:hypothetical protein
VRIYNYNPDVNDGVQRLDIEARRSEGGRVLGSFLGINCLAEAVVVWNDDVVRGAARGSHFIRLTYREQVVDRMNTTCRAFNCYVRR